MDFSSVGFYDLLPWQWAAWIGMGLAAGLTKTGLSGMTAITIPVIAVIFGARQSTGLNLPVLCLADIMAVWYYNRHAEWKYIFRLLPWTLTGFAAAILAERFIPVQAFRYMMGGSILAGLLVMIWSDIRGKDKPPPSQWWFSAVFGILGGFASTVGNVSGPIMAVFLLSMRLPKNSYIGTTAWYFMIVNLMKMPIQIFVWKNISSQTLLLDLIAVPAIIAGAALGIFLVKRIPEKIFRKVIICLTLVSTIMLFI